MNAARALGAVIISRHMPDSWHLAVFVHDNNNCILIAAESLNFLSSYFAGKDEVKARILCTWLIVYVGGKLSFINR